MKDLYKYIIAALVLSASASLHAQTFSFYRTSPALIYTNDTFGVISYGKVHNLTGTNNQIRIIRTVVNVPPGWETCICDIVQCHPPGMDTAIAYYPPGLSDIAVMIYCHSIPGTGYVTFRAEKVSNTNENYSVTFGGAYNPIGINQLSSEATEYSLSQNYPNPFNPTTNIRFEVPAVGQRHAFDLQIVIYDILGREVETLVKQQIQPGTYEIEWNAANYPSGVYYYRLTAGEFSDTKKMVLIK